MSKPRGAMPRIVEAETTAPSRSRARSPTWGSSPFTTRTVDRELAHRRAPALRDQLQLSVPVELVTEEVPRQTARGRTR